MGLRVSRTPAPPRIYLWGLTRAMGAFLPEKRAAFFNVGDLVTFGKYQNKRARIVAFHDDGKGNPLVELEPLPKGRKKNKVIALFKIRHVANIEKVARAREIHEEADSRVALNVMGRFVASRL